MNNFNPVSLPSDWECSKCGGSVYFYPHWSLYSCSCPGSYISVDQFKQGRFFTSWFCPINLPAPPPEPASGDNCRKCGKALTVQGLNKSYPPQRDAAGTVICPHCGAPQSQSIYRAEPQANAAIRIKWSNSPFNNPFAPEEADNNA